MRSSLTLTEEDRLEIEARTQKRRAWPKNMIFLGGGMVIGGGVDISGPGGGIFLVGLLVAVVGLLGLIFSSDQ